MERSPSGAERVFASWLVERARAGPSAFDALLRQHPDRASELERLYRSWTELEIVLRLSGLHVTQRLAFGERLREAHGEGLSPDVSLDGDHEQPSNPTSALLERIDRGAAGSRYRIEDEIGHGGMGAIVRAYDVDLRRHLAMKVMLDGRGAEADRVMLARFLEEAQVTGQLDHPGIVPVHELGLDAHGRVFFTMKLVKGRNLAQIYKLVRDDAEGWNETRALNVLLKVCEAMAYAHQKGVVHRDLKPANVMVGYFGEVYVMDWGLARVRGRPDRRDLRIAPERMATRSVQTERREEREQTPDSPIVTMDGDVVGTPAYMSPEQARGAVERIDARSDVYAIGAMLYHLIAGHAPYVSDDDARVSPRTLLGMVLHGPPSPVHRQRPDVPAELAAICEKAMARDPERRYAGTLELAEDLRAYLEHRVVRAYRTGAWVELRKWVRRNRATAAAIGAVVVAVVAGVVLNANWRAASARRDLLLADVRRAQALRAGVDELWPALPARLEGLRAWIAEVDLLVARRPALEDLAQDLARDPARREQAAGVAGLLGEAFPALVAARARIEARERLASTVEERTVGSPAARERWRAASEAIAASPRYGGLRLAPQLGLLPLAPDPKTGLWEFWHVLSGDEPALDRGTGRWTIGAETGIVLVLVPGATCTLGARPMARPEEETYESWDAILLASTDFADARKPFHDPGCRAGEALREGVVLAPFFVSKYELTQAQWERAMGTNPSHHPGPTLPVESIDWHEARAVLARLALVLPTDAQWEYACRAGTDSIFCTGWELGSLNGHANIADATFAASHPDDDASPGIDDGYESTAAVGSFDANGFGLHDVLGNVWEWCQDGYRVARAPRSGDGLDVGAEALHGRCIRGGSFSTPAVAVRSASRFDLGFLRSNADADLGVRPARAVDP